MPFIDVVPPDTAGISLSVLRTHLIPVLKPEFFDCLPILCDVGSPIQFSVRELACAYSSSVISPKPSGSFCNNGEQFLFRNPVLPRMQHLNNSVLLWQSAG
jgi:hypothetical protein